MTYQAEYIRWMESPVLTDAERQELAAIAGQEEEIEDRFYREVEFGTAGMRGILGIGTNRMNIYTVRRATMGVAHYIKTQGEHRASNALFSLRFLVIYGYYAFLPKLFSNFLTNNI